MKTAREFRAEAAHLRSLARDVTDRLLLEKIAEMIDELERRAQELDDEM